MAIGAGSYVWEAVLKDEKDIDKIHALIFEIDHEPPNRS